MMDRMLAALLAGVLAGFIAGAVQAATTQYATPGTYAYGIKYLDSSGYPSQASIDGSFVVAPDIPKAVS